ncbi:DUF5641 domain-containing protein [Trichonephila clavipes]|nr:DUF5641 domain-containing protein [Trichonephila clavipes]
MLKDFCNWTRQNPSQKRIVLQSAGKIYDPVGFLSLYTIRLKCLLQELWLRKLSWDNELPPDIHAVWSQWCGDSSEVQIHTFFDASQKAYGAATFLRVKHKDRVSVDLVTSKSRVAPLKRLSLPRLELMGALLAARLAKEVKKILDQKCSTRAFFWTDSQVTLHWIKGPSHRWKPFVANRVREIQSLTDPNAWFHCSGKDNPADLLTRGISVDALTTNSKWWNGSSFLRQIYFQTTGLDEAIPEGVYLTEMRKNSNPKEDISLTLTVTKNNFLENIIDISNNYVKLIRVVSFLYRFIHNCRTRITKIKGPLTSRSPNHGGLWEAGVKAFKFHLKRVVGNAHLTLEEFITILCEIEAVLNSRPLTPLTSNFDDFETLTPGHFLVGRPLTSIVEAQITNINENQLSRWERDKESEAVYGSGKDEIAQFVKKCPGVKGLRSLGSEESGDKGREFRTASICAINVVNSSKFMIADFATLNKMRFMDLMFASHNPPKWGEAGGMKFHSIPSSALNS